MRIDTMNEEGQTKNNTAIQHIRPWFEKMKREEKLNDATTLENLTSQLGPYVTFSRQAGTGTEEISRLVGERLNWMVLGKEFLDIVGEWYHTPQSILEFLDEKKANWVYELFGNWMDNKAIPQVTYVRRLGKIMLLAAHHGNIVFVGRGATWLLPRENGFAVRLVASETYRVEQFRHTQKLSYEEARRKVKKIDNERYEYVQHYFYKQVTDPEQYDMVINIEKLDIDGIVDVIVKAVESWLDTNKSSS